MLNSPEVRFESCDLKKHRQLRSIAEFGSPQTGPKRGPWLLRLPSGSAQTRSDPLRVEALTGAGGEKSYSLCLDHAREVNLRDVIVLSVN